MIAESFNFPEINSILRWQDLFVSFNKIALIAVAAGVIGIMVVAIVVAHAKVGFFVFLPNQGWEYCATIAIIEQEWSANQVLRWYNDPYAFLTPAPARKIFGSSAAATFNAGWASQANRTIGIGAGYAP